MPVHMQAGMFNDRSTHSERQQVLQKLMQKGTADLGQGVPSDSELNSLLARSKAELVSFAQVHPDYLNSIRHGLLLASC